MIEFNKNQNIYIDIDNTICNTDGLRYERAKPIKENIKIINKLYDQGNIITYWTARGTLSKTNYYDLTKKQLLEWGCKFHELKMGKPAFDLFIDDKAINSKEFFNVSRYI